MNWPRWLTISVLGLAVATFILLVFVLIGLVRINETVQGQDAARDRSLCITDTTAPFFEAVALALVELDDSGTLTALTSRKLTDSADDLATVNERCPA